MLEYDGFFYVGLINSIGWEIKVLQMFRDEFDDPKPNRIDGHELLANGRFRVAVAMFKDRKNAMLFGEVAREVIKDMEGFDGLSE